MAESSVLYEVGSGVATLTLNRPAVLNALDQVMVAEFADRVEAAEKDADVWVVVVRGAGRALIENLVALAREGGWRRIYWHTHEGNTRARALYDRIVERTDYVRYDIDL